MPLAIVDEPEIVVANFKMKSILKSLICPEFTGRTKRSKATRERDMDHDIDHGDHDIDYILQ